MLDATEWLYNFFSKKGNIPGKDKAEQLRADIFESALIDSFGIVELITEMESLFGIELKSEDIQSQEFRTIEGLAKILEHRVNEKGKR